MSAKGVRRILLAGTAAFASIGTAQAQTSTEGTIAGTTISNTAQASYTVNGTPQTASSNTATFLVDRKVNLTVIANQPTNTSVNLSQVGAVTTFKVTNNTNGIQDIGLSAQQNIGVGGTGTDNYDMSNLKVYVDSNGNGTYDPGVDVATYADEIAPDASVIVFIVGDVPNQTNADTAIVSLNATIEAGGTAGTQGAVLAETTGVNSDTAIDVVFADGDSDGLLGADIARNGQGRAYLGYTVTTHNVALSVTKSSLVISDPTNLLVNPKAIPGATVQYCLTVQNGTPLVNASNVTLTDVIPANTTYVPGSISVGGLGTGGVCVLNGFAVNDDGTQNPLSPYGGAFNGTTKTVSASIPTLLGLTSLSVAFRVTVN